MSWITPAVRIIIALTVKLHGKGQSWEGVKWFPFLFTVSQLQSFLCTRRLPVVDDARKVGWWGRASWCAHRCLSCKDHREVFRLFQKCLIRTNMRKMEEHLLSISGKKNFLLPLFPDFFFSAKGHISVQVLKILTKDNCSATLQSLYKTKFSNWKLYYQKHYHTQPICFQQHVPLPHKHPLEPVSETRQQNNWTKLMGPAGVLPFQKSVKKVAFGAQPKTQQMKREIQMLFQNQKEKAKSLS